MPDCVYEDAAVCTYKIHTLTKKDGNDNKTRSDCIVVMRSLQQINNPTHLCRMLVPFESDNL